MATDTLLQGVIGELQKTNALIAEGNKDPSLGSSIKQNLGEILNASRLQGDDQSYTERKGIDQTDDEVKKLNKQAGEDSTVLEKILNSVIAISKGQPTQSQEQAKTKKEQFQAMSIKDALKGIYKGIVSLKNDVIKGLTTGFKGKLALFALLAMLPKILNSESFMNFLRFLDDKFLPAIKGINEFLRKNVTEPLNKFGDMIGLEGLGDSVANIALVALAIAGLLAPIKTLKFLLLDIPTFLGLNRFNRKKAAFNRGKRFLRKTRQSRRNLSKKVRTFAQPFKKLANRKTLISGAKIAGKAALAGAKFIPFAGLIVAAGQGIFDGVKAGLDKAKDETATKADIAKSVLVGGAVSVLTLGFGTPEGVSKFFGGIGDKIGEKFTAFKEMLPTKDELKEKMAGFAEGLKGKLTELGDKFTSLKNDMISKFEDITGIELPSFEEVSEKIKNFGADLKKRVIDAIPTKEKIKEFGGKLLQFGKDLIKKDATQEQIDAAVTAALQKHFEETHTVEKMNENALNKMGGGETTIVNNISQDNSNDVKQEVVNNHSKQIAHNNALHTSIASSG